MSENATIDMPRENAEAELGRQIREAFATAGEPQGVSQIVKQLPASVRPSEEAASAVVAQEVDAGRLFSFPPLRGKPQFWTKPPSEYAKQKLLNYAHSDLMTRSMIVSKVKALSMMKGISKAEVQRSFDAMVREGVIQKLPPFLGARTALFSSRPADPADYLQDALLRLSKKLDLTRREVYVSFEPDEPEPTATPDSAVVASDAAETSSDDSIRIDQRIVEAMIELDPRAGDGVMVSIAQLRQLLSVHLPDDAFDRALLEQSAAGFLAIHHYDRAAHDDESARKQLLRDEDGNFYNTVSLSKVG